MGKILSIIFLVVVIFLGLTYHFTNTDNIILQDRRDYWIPIVNAELPVGTPKTVIAQWANDRSLTIQETNINEFKRIVVFLEKVKDRGFGIPCSSWDINAEFDMGPSDTVTYAKIITDEHCLID